MPSLILLNRSIFIDLAQLSAGQQSLLALPDEPLADSLPLDGFRPGLLQMFSPEHQPSKEEIDDMVWLVGREDGDRLLPRLIRYIEARRRHQELWTAGLTGFAGPLHALWGLLDTIAIPAMVERLRDLRPETRVITWDDVGHWPALEVPDRVLAAVLSALAP